MKKDDCVFCGIVAELLPARRIYEDKELLAFEDLNPKAPIHILIIPKKHISSLLTVADEDLPLLSSALALAGRLAQEKGIDRRGFRVVTNTGPDAGQSVFHLHFHLLGGRSLGWPPG